MKKTWLMLALFAGIAMPASPVVAAPSGASARGTAPAKQILKKMVPPGARASANDTCAAATVIPPAGPFPYTDTVDTTGNGTDPTVPACGGSVDAWWTFTPSSSGAYIVQTCSSSFDTILAVYAGTCGTLAEMACNDDNCGLQSYLQVDLTAGTAYYIQVLGFSGDFGTAALIVDPADPTPSVYTDFDVSYVGLYPWAVGISNAAGAPLRAGWVWIGEYCSLSMTEYTTAGAPTGMVWTGYWADYEYDETRNIMYSMDIANSGCGGRLLQDNCIHTWDPVYGTAGPTICDPGGTWSAVANQGVAHDPVSDTLYVGGWSTDTVYHIQGLSGTTPGAILGSWSSADVAGMAWLCDGTLAIVRSNLPNSLDIAEPLYGSVLRSYTLPGGGTYAGAGLDAEPTVDGGALWGVSQNSKRVYRMDVGAACAPCPTITLSPATLPDGSTGTPYSQVLSAAGGTAPYTYAVTAGALPPGLALDGATGLLSGTPTSAGSFSFTVTATDANGCTGEAPYTVTVTVPAYDIYIYDDYGRASLCLNSATGEFLYSIHTGYGAGSTFTGIATMTIYNGVANFAVPAGLPYSLNGQYLQRYFKGKAAFSHRPLRITSTAYDSNTRNNPPGCATIPD